jgi:succinyl-CoA synthetase beta subunit
MLLHEYQAKEILRSSGIPILPGEMVTTVEDAVRSARRIGGKKWAVKAQIHAGGRGKAGGIRIARSLEEVAEHARALLKKTLVTPQTGPSGKPVHKLYIEGGCEIVRELYLSVTLDRKSSRLMVILSGEGGMDIEEVARTSPEKIHRIPVDPRFGLSPFEVRPHTFQLGLAPEEAVRLADLITRLAVLAVKLDALLLEINPLVLASDRRFIPLDAKLDIDDNALFRHPELRILRDETQEDPKEVEAKRWGINYIALDGNIGCLVNGAGLAMATMDTILHFGGKPANFLDVGGGANREQVTQAFKIILLDPRVRAILVNIFGGIMRCDTIAEGILHAVRDLELKVPLVVRLEGTNVEEGRRILKESGLPIETAPTLAEAAKKAVELSRNKS